MGWLTKVVLQTKKTFGSNFIEKYFMKNYIN